MFRHLTRAMLATLLALAALVAVPASLAAQDVPPISAAPAPPPAGPAPAAMPAPAGLPAVVPAAPPAGAVTLSEGYVLGPGDVIEVVLVGRTDFQARVQVQVDGSVQLPLIGDVPAANRTVLQMRSDIRDRLMSGGFYANPSIAVAVVTFASRYVTVLGEVASPGLVPVDRAYRVSEILARVGGPRPSAADDITIRRADDSEVTLSIRDVATGGDAQDPIVNPGDKIFIAIAPQYFIYGQVNSPGSYRVERGMSLRMALARGGGLTALGSERRVQIFRNGVELRRFDPGALIEGGDVIVVGERFF